MRRREVITLLGGAVMWPLAARAQQPAMPAVGILDNIGTDAVAAFRNGLNETGYVEGRNVTIELRATNQYDRLPALVTELVERRVAVIAALGGPAALVAKAAKTTPIVFSIGGDPVELGLVSSLNHPGGNITGATFFAAQLLQKQLGLLRELIPNAAVAGVLINPNNPRASADVNTVKEAARTLGFEIHVTNAATESDLDTAFASLLQRRADALIVAGDAVVLRARARLAALAARHAIPTIFASREYAEAGGLLTYGAKLTDAHRQAGMYTGRILNGEKPAVLPVIQPTRFELVINLKTAKALSLTIPNT